MSAPVLRVRYGSQTCSPSAAPQMKITEFMSEIQILTELFASHQEMSWGHPPQQIPTDSTAFPLTIADLGIKCRGLFTVSERSQSTTPMHAKSRIDEAVKVDIAGDNSRLVFLFLSGFLSPFSFSRWRFDSRSRSISLYSAASG
jgi:hypothetical protein